MLSLLLRFHLLPHHDVVPSFFSPSNFTFFLGLSFDRNPILESTNSSRFSNSEERPDVSNLLTVHLAGNPDITKDLKRVFYEGQRKREIIF